MLPTFYCIGAQKAGTTWLYECLAEHPEVFVPEHKEVNWFRGWGGRPSLYQTHGLSPYERLFDAAGDHSARGDISPGLMAAHCAETLHALTPSAVILVMLRDPVARAHSHYQMLAGRHRLPFTFEELCADPSRDDPHEILEEGRYAKHLRPFVERFGRITVLRYEELASAPDTLLRRACEAIGVDPAFEPTALHERVNAAGTYRVRALYEARVKIAEALARSRLDPIRVAIKRMGVPRLVDRLARRSAPNAPLLPMQRAQLAHHYAAEVRALESLIGQDFSEWTAVASPRAER